MWKSRTESFCLRLTQYYNPQCCKNIELEGKIDSYHVFKFWDYFPHLWRHFISNVDDLFLFVCFFFAASDLSVCNYLPALTVFLSVASQCLGDRVCSWCQTLFFVLPGKRVRILCFQIHGSRQFPSLLNPFFPPLHSSFPPSLHALSFFPSSLPPSLWLACILADT